jgi:hypothetical protein
LLDLRRSEPWKNEKFLVAKVGCGGMGGSDLGEVAKHKSVEIVTLCDIDRRQLDTLTKGGKDEEAKECFKLFDKRDKGYVTSNDLKSVLPNYLEFPVTDMEI